MMADGLTKALQGPAFKEFTHQLGMTDITSLIQEKELSNTTPEDLEELILDELEVADIWGSRSI